jgi:hypothetical protein
MKASLREIQDAAVVDAPANPHKSKTAARVAPPSSKLAET